MGYNYHIKGHFFLAVLKLLYKMEIMMDSSAEQGGVTLKSLLQNPFLLLPKEKDPAQQKPDMINKDGDAEMSDKQKEKEKELELNFDPFSNVDPTNAFLGPKLWDDSMLLDGDKDLKFEFMDIDEFLVEQGILDPSKEKKLTGQTIDNDSNGASAEAQVDDVSAEDTTSKDAADALSVSPQDVIAMSILNQTSSDSTNDSITTSLLSPPRTPSPVTVDVNFELSHTDVALATIPGEDVYDPKSKKFNDEELKPQPMIKKAKKVFVPEEQKDDKYWERRRKNNVAASRSRHARRIKENQIVLRAAYLEKENGVLKQDVIGLRKENVSLKSVVQKLEKELKNAQDQASLLS